MNESDGKPSSIQVESADKRVHGQLPDTFDDLNDVDLRALERELVRKIDLHLISSLFLLFIFNILDHDLHLTDTQYQAAVAIMLLGQIPSNILLTRLKPSRYLPTAIFIWGGISLCTAATKDFTGIMCVRVFLGFAESPFFPGGLLLTSSWYKPSEIALRVAIVYCGNTIANGFGSIFCCGRDEWIGRHGGWLFSVKGAGTMVAGLLAVLLLPEFPRSGQRKWLTAQEQRFAEWRLARDTNDEVDENGSVKEGLRDALTDPKAWLLVLIQVCQLTSQSWTYFFPTIAGTLGLSQIITLLVIAPAYVCGSLVSLGNSLIANHTDQRAVLIVWPLCVDIVGNVMVIAAHTTAVRYIGMFLMCAGSYSAFNVVQAWIASTTPRTRTKRAVVYALVNLFGNSSNIYGSARRAEERDGQARYKYIW
ncbi:MFS general substrate transporter [Aspergillus recurvatus]